MKLEEMQAALNSEAVQKAKTLEKEKHHLKVAIRKKQERIDQMEDTLRAMFNRCYATAAMHTGGTMCFFCGQRKECDRLRSVGKGGNADAKEKE